MGKFKVIISERAQEDLLALEQSGDRGSIKKAAKIVSELYEHPETGTGKPERLKYKFSGFWSRQINKKDRLIYLIEDEVVTVTVVSAKGHYGDK